MSLEISPCFPLPENRLVYAQNEYERAYNFSLIDPTTFPVTQKKGKLSSEEPPLKKKDIILDGRAHPSLKEATSH